MVSWLILLCGVMSQSDAVTYRLSAVPEKVAIGQTLTITAQLINPTQANTDLRFLLTQPGKQANTFFQYRTATGCIFVQEPYISTGTVVTCDPANSRYVIRFQSVTSDHVGRYESSAPLEMPSRSIDQGVSANVQLLASPTTATITPSHLEVIEGQPTNFVCAVDDQATTPVIFVWRRIVNGNRVNPPYEATTTMISGDRSNRMSWHSVSRQYAGQYVCVAMNRVGILTSQPATLVVYYPATSVTLTNAATTVSVGASVTFSCTSTGGNPRPGLVIYDAVSGRVWQESVQWGSSSLTYGPVAMQKSANGAKYGCKTKASVRVGSIPVRKSNTLTLDVQFPPNYIKSPSAVTVDEGSSTTVRCETATTSNPQTELAWTGPGVGQSVESTSLGAHNGVNTVQVVTLIGDRTRNGATYTCTATYLGQQIYTKSTKLNVNFAPKAIAFYDTLDTPILENQERVMRCRAKTSKPAGTIVWRKMLNGNPSVIPAGSPTEVSGDFGGTVLETEITDQPSRRDNGAKYWCEVEYTYANGTKITRRAASKLLEVYYPVDVAIMVSQRAHDIREGDPVNLTCETRGGNPRNIDKYSWSRNGNVLVHVSERTLSLNPIQYDQGGNYFCSATNKGGRSNTSIDVDVKFKPRLDHTTAHRWELAAVVGESAIFSLTILANPAPTFVQWSAADRVHSLSPRFLQTDDGNVYSFIVKDITIQDFTTYKCLVTNVVGSSIFLVTLTSKGPPDTPSNFEVSAKSNDTITLQWTSEFSGATNHTFLLEQIIPAERVYKTFEVADPGIEIGSTIIHVVKNLKPGTEYAFRLKSVNDLRLFSLYTETTAITKPGMYPRDLDVRIAYVDETTIAVTWQADEDLIRNYRNAILRIQYTPVRVRFRRAFNLPHQQPAHQGVEWGSFTAKFSNGRAIFNVSQGVLHSFDLIVIDDDNRVVLRLSNLKADRMNRGETAPSFGMPLRITFSVMALVLLIGMSAIVAICCHRKRKLKWRPKSTSRPPDPLTAKSPDLTQTTAFDNAAFLEENPYMVPVDADPAFYHYSGNKYAVVDKPDVNDVTDNDYDVIPPTGEDDYATIGSPMGDGLEDDDYMEAETGYMDMSGVTYSQGHDEKSVPEDEYIESNNRHDKASLPEDEYTEIA